MSACCIAEQLGPACAALLRRLARRPELELAVLELRGAVLRLERRVGHERIRVRRLDTFAAPPSAASTSPSLRSVNAPAPASTSSAACVAKPSLLCAAVGPSSHVTFSFLRARLRLPPAVGDDRDAADAGRCSSDAVDDERVPDAGQRLDLVQVGADDLAAEHRALLVHRLQHARQREVDAEQRLAGDDRQVVDAGCDLPMILSPSDPSA